MVVTDFGGRAAVCLRGAWRSLYRVCPGLCGAGSWKRRPALCGAWSFIRSAGIRWPGIRATRARLQSSCVLWSPWTGIRPTASLYRARAGLPIRLCGRICTEAARRDTLQRRWSLRRQSRLWPVGILQLKHDGKMDGSNASRPNPVKAITLLLNVSRTLLSHLAPDSGRTERRLHHGAPRTALISLNCGRSRVNRFSSIVTV
jgi:hypothetical protein